MNNNNLVKNWKKFLLEQDMAVMTPGDGGGGSARTEITDKELEKALVKLDQRLDRERWLKRAKEAERRSPGDSNSIPGLIVKAILSGLVSAIEFYNPFDFLLQWQDAPEDLKEYYEDFETALQQKDYFRALSAYQCTIVTALSMIPVGSKFRKAVGLTREGLANLQKLILFARGVAGFLINSGSDSLRDQGKKLKTIIDNSERQGKLEDQGNFDGAGSTDDF